MEKVVKERLAEIALDEHRNDYYEQQKSSILALVSGWPRHPMPEQDKAYHEALDILLKIDPNIDAVTDDDYKRTALHIACKEGHERVIQKLLEAGADGNIKDAHDSVSLEYITNYAWRAKRECLLSIYYLSAMSEDIDNIGTSEDDNTALGWACIYGGNTLTVVSALLEAGANPNKKNNRGQTPLMLASASDRVDIVILLVYFDANLDDVDNDGKTALDIAREQKRKKVVAFLESNL